MMLHFSLSGFALQNNFPKGTFCCLHSRDTQSSRYVHVSSYPLIRERERDVVKHPLSSYSNQYSSVWRHQQLSCVWSWFNRKTFKHPLYLYYTLFPELVSRPLETHPLTLLSLFSSLNILLPFSGEKHRHRLFLSPLTSSRVPFTALQAFSLLLCWCLECEWVKSLSGLPIQIDWYLCWVI